jgi:hypothetical protein
MEARTFKVLIFLIIISSCFANNLIFNFYSRLFNSKVSSAFNNSLIDIASFKNVLGCLIRCNVNSNCTVVAFDTASNSCFLYSISIQKNQTSFIESSSYFNLYYKYGRNHSVTFYYTKF